MTLRTIFRDALTGVLVEKTIKIAVMTLIFRDNIVILQIVSDFENNINRITE